MIEVTGNEPFDEQAEFYASLKINLEKNHNFPEDYLYKFIIVNNQEKLTEIYKVFDGTKNTFSTRESSNGKYISITIQCFVLDAEHVIRLYKDVAKIEGVIML
jgi:putative lipoic acid-binding regulatory protein